MRKIRKIIGLIRPISPIGPISLIGLIVLLLSACNRYEIEQYYTGKAKVHVDVDWKSLFKDPDEKPSGMTIMLAKDGDAITYTDITNDVDSFDLNLEPGNYKMLIFNRTIGEFGSMGFAQTKSFNDIFSFSRQQQRTTDFWDTSVGYMREPENIGCAVDTFTVLPDMIDGEFRFVNWKDKVVNDTKTLRIQEVVEPMTTEMYIQVRVIGFKYMASVIGNISGLADGFLLSQAWRRPQSGYHLLDNWSYRPIIYDDDQSKSEAYITTTIRTFGLPHGRELDEQREPSSNVLSLMFTLIDGKTCVFRYPVGKMIKYRTIDTDTDVPKSLRTRAGSYFNKTDVTLELDLVVDAPVYDEDELPNLPYAQPSGTGAFDADVEPWGDDVNVDVPM